MSSPRCWAPTGPGPVAAPSPGSYSPGVAVTPSLPPYDRPCGGLDRWLLRRRARTGGGSVAGPRPVVLGSVAWPGPVAAVPWLLPATTLLHVRMAPTVGKVTPRIPHTPVRNWVFLQPSLGPMAEFHRLRQVNATAIIMQSWQIFFIMKNDVRSF